VVKKEKDTRLRRTSARSVDAQTATRRKSNFKLPFRLMFFDIEISSYNLLISTGFIKINAFDFDPVLKIV